MSRLCLLCALVISLLGAPPARATVLLINEVVANHVGTDTHEYVEVYFQSPNYDLSAFTLLQIEGDGSGAGVIDGAYPLGTTDANGYWTTGYLNNMIENGTMTLLLVSSFAGSVGQDLDTDNNGTLDSTPWYNNIIYSSIAISDGGAGDRTYSSVVLTPAFDGGNFTVGGASRIPDATNTNSTSDWVRNDFDGRGIVGFTGTPTTGEAINTPLAENALWIPPADPVINEFVANHTGSDTNEFIEIYGLPDTDYSHLKLIAVDGDGLSAGFIDAIFSIGTTDANGFWSTGALPADALENGTQTFLLGEGFFGAVGQDLDTDNDGVLNVNPFARTADAVAVNDGTAGDDTYAPVVLVPGFDGDASTVGGASRIPNGTDSDTVADWMRNDFDGDGLAGFTGTPAANEARNTPGTTNLTAIDETPPTITVDPNRSALWPPNHRLMEVCVTVTVSDDREPAPTYVLTSVTSSEPDDGKGDGHTRFDVREADAGTGDLCFWLRAERSGTGEGREYTIVYTATDGAGNTTQGTAVVTVPHDQSGAALASTGYTGAGYFAPGAETFSLVIPSTPRQMTVAADGSPVVLDDGLRAGDVDPHLACVGNAVGVVRPLSSMVGDFTGDGEADIMLQYSVAGALALDPRGEGLEGDTALGLHYEGPDGTDYFVESIFALPAAGVTAEIGHPSTIETRATNALGIQPNPFNPATTVSIEMRTAGYASVRIFDVRGALVKTLHSGAMTAGRHDLRWDGRDNGGRSVASGIYFVRFENGAATLTRRAVLLK